MKFVLLVFSILFLSPIVAFSFVIEKQQDIFVHKSESNSLINNFIDDVSSLLPAEMQNALNKEQNYLHKQAQFVPASDYWKRRLPSKKEFKERYCLTSTSDINRFADKLASTIRPIFEIAMRPAEADAMNEGLQKNMLQIIMDNRWMYMQQHVDYKGYMGRTSDEIIDELYELKRINKNDLYPYLVVITADLWTSIWRNNGHQASAKSYTFVRDKFEFVLNLKENSCRKSLIGKWQFTGYNAANWADGLIRELCNMNDAKRACVIRKYDSMGISYQEADHRNKLNLAKESCE